MLIEIKVSEFIKYFNDYISKKYGKSIFANNLTYNPACFVGYLDCSGGSLKYFKYVNFRNENIISQAQRLFDDLKYFYNILNGTMNSNFAKKHKPLHHIGYPYSILNIKDIFNQNTAFRYYKTAKCPLHNHFSMLIPNSSLKINTKILHFYNTAPITDDMKQKFLAINQLNVNLTKATNFFLNTLRRNTKNLHNDKTTLNYNKAQTINLSSVKSFGNISNEDVFNVNNKLKQLYTLVQILLCTYKLLCVIQDFESQKIYNRIKNIENNKYKIDDNFSQFLYNFNQTIMVYLEKLAPEKFKSNKIDTIYSELTNIIKAINKTLNTTSTKPTEYAKNLVDLLATIVNTLNNELPQLKNPLNIIQNDLTFEFQALKKLFLDDSIDFNAKVKSLFNTFLSKPDMIKDFSKSYCKFKGCSIPKIKNIKLNVDTESIYMLQHFLPMIEKFISNLKNANSISLAYSYSNKHPYTSSAYFYIFRNFIENVNIKKIFSSPCIFKGKGYENPYPYNEHYNGHFVYFINRVLHENKNISILNLEHQKIRNFFSFKKSLPNIKNLYVNDNEHIFSSFSYSYGEDLSDLDLADTFPNLEVLEFGPPLNTTTSFVNNNTSTNTSNITTSLNANYLKPQINYIMCPDILKDLRIFFPKLKDINLHAKFRHNGYIDKTFLEFLDTFKHIDSKISRDINIEVSYDFNNDIKYNRNVERETVNYRYLSLERMKNNYEMFSNLIANKLQNNFLTLKLAILNYYSTSKHAIPHLGTELTIIEHEIAKFTREKHFKKPSEVTHNKPGGCTYNLPREDAQNKQIIDNLENHIKNLNIKKQQILLNIYNFRRHIASMEQSTMTRWNKLFDVIHKKNIQTKKELQHVLILIGLAIYQQTCHYELGISKHILEYMYNRKKIIFSLFDRNSYQQYCNYMLQYHNLSIELPEKKLELFSDILSENSTFFSVQSKIFIENIEKIHNLLMSDMLLYNNKDHAISTTLSEIDVFHRNKTFLALQFICLMSKFFNLIPSIFKFNFEKNMPDISFFTGLLGNIYDDEETSNTNNEPFTFIETLNNENNCNFFKIIKEKTLVYNNEIQYKINALHNQLNETQIYASEKQVLDLSLNKIFNNSIINKMQNIYFLITNLQQNSHQNLQENSQQNSQQNLDQQKKQMLQPFSSQSSSNLSSLSSSSLSSLSSSSLSSLSMNILTTDNYQSSLSSSSSLKKNMLTTDNYHDHDHDHSPTKNNMHECILEQFRNIYSSFVEIVEILKNIEQKLENDKRYLEAKQPAEKLRKKIGNKCNSEILNVFQKKINNYVNRSFSLSLGRISKKKKKSTENGNKFSRI